MKTGRILTSGKRLRLDQRFLKEGIPSLIKLSANQIKQHANHSSIGDVHVFDSLDSTNTWALSHASCGDACLAEQQTAGRGRRGRTWHSPQQGNLYLSLKWCFDEIPEHFALLSLLVGIVIAECLHEEGLREHGVKWPNDILWQGKKLGGILLESKGKPNHIVIGIGLNIAMHSQEAIDQPWISLNRVLDRAVDRNRLAGRLLSRLVERLRHFQQLDLSQFCSEWTACDILKDKAVTVLHDDKTIYGEAIGINQHGLFELRLDNGSKQQFSAADISIRSKVE